MAKALSLATRPASRAALAVYLTFTVLALGMAGVARAETGTVTSGGLRIRDEPWGAVTGLLSSEATVRINARSFDQQGEPWYYVTAPACCSPLECIRKWWPSVWATAT